jgi:hypothetical protein
MRLTKYRPAIDALDMRVLGYQVRSSFSQDGFRKFSQVFSFKPLCRHFVSTRSLIVIQNFGTVFAHILLTFKILWAVHSLILRRGHTKKTGNRNSIAISENCYHPEFSTCYCMEQRKLRKLRCRCHSVTCVQLRLITNLGNCGCAAVASFLGVPSALSSTSAITLLVERQF